MKVDGYDIPENINYNKEHEWVKLEERGLVRIGITDYAQKMLKEITWVYLPDVGLSVKRSEVVCKIESVKAMSEIYSPFDGRIIEVNGELRGSPYLINDDPYNRGWIIAMRTSESEDKSRLLTARQYAKYVRDLIKVDEDLLIYRWRKTE